jgi:hypothetical protein
LSPQRQRRQVSSECRRPLYQRRCVTSQKKRSLIYAAVKNSNLAFCIICRYLGLFWSVLLFPIDTLVL